MRFRNAALGLTMVAALAVAPTGVHGAIAGVQDDRMNSAPIVDLESRLDLVKDTNARVTRIDVLWSEVAPTPPANPDDHNDPAYDWARSDILLSGFVARGITPIVTVFSAPSWATGGKGALKDRQYNANMPNPVAYGRFMGALAKRYDGSLNTGAYALAAPRARHFEIWNEPNLSRFLVPQFDKRGRGLAARNYVKLVQASYNRIKSANPRAIVIIGSGGPKSTTRRTGRVADQGYGSLDWLVSLQKLKRSMKFDAYSQHIYPAQPPIGRRVVVPNWASIPLLLAETNKLKRNVPVYITEAGYTTQRTPIRLVSVSFSQQALYLRQIFGLRNVRSKRIPVVIWFNLQDNVLWPGGLRRLDMSPKPSLKAFRAVANQGSLPAALRP